VYVHSDADLEITSQRLVWGKCYNAGQTCIAPDYVLVNEKVRKPLLEKLSKTITSFYGADPTKSKDFEQISNERHVQRLSALLKGQNIYLGGRVDVSNRYIEPTIILDPSPDSPIMQEEIFGPILPILSVSSPEEAIEFINSRPKPLALYVFSQDGDVKSKIISQTSAGGVMTNDVLMHFMNDYLPFGGVGDSGLGAYHGKYSFESFTHFKPVQHASALPEPPLRFPPYTERKLNMVAFLAFTLSPSRINKFFWWAYMIAGVGAAYWVYTNFIGY
jgi:aldehyde dehydrogenase (NAD+)